MFLIPCIAPTGPANTYVSFQVPDAGSSDEESYGSSRMDESESESDSSAPEVQPLQKSNDAEVLVPDSLAHVADNSTTYNQSKLADVLDPPVDSSLWEGSEGSDVLYRDETRSRSPADGQARAPSPPPAQVDVLRDASPMGPWSPIFGLVPIAEDSISVVSDKSLSPTALKSVGCQSSPSDGEYPFDLESLKYQPNEGLLPINRDVPPHDKSNAEDRNSVDEYQTNAYIQPTENLKADTTSEVEFGTDEQPQLVDLSQQEENSRLNQNSEPPKDCPSVKSPLHVPRNYISVSDGAQRRSDIVTVESLLNYAPPAPKAGSYKSEQLNYGLPGAASVTGQSQSRPWPYSQHDVFADFTPANNSSFHHQEHLAPACIAPLSLTSFEHGNKTSFETNLGVLDSVKPKNSISISDIVEHPETSMESSRGLKRKADVLDESELARGLAKSELSDTVETNSAEVSVPASNNTSFISTAATTPNNNSSSRSKRLKLHTGSTLFGAVVGGVGMFAALAFLPETLFQ